MHSTARVLMLVAFATNCASGAGRSAAGGSGVLTRGEMHQTDTSSTYDAVAALRPQWLRSRGPTSLEDPTPTFPHVYVDGRNAGEIDALKSIYVRDVVEMRFYEPGQAAVRFGMGHPRGVIEVVTVRRHGDGPTPDPQR